ncbi:hypothetical protein ACSBR2_040702 [Camellia fascicularis]
MSNRVRGSTVGKGVQKRLARKKGEKLHVYVNRMLNALTGGNATPATNETRLKLVRISILINKLKRSLIRRRISCTRIGGVCLDDWKHMIDVAWKDESHLKCSKAGKTNRSLLPYNHTSGSRSFPIAMSLMDAVMNLQVIATDAGIPLTHKELSQQVLGQRKNYLRGFGIGPRPYSPSDSADDLVTNK